MRVIELINRIGLVERSLENMYHVVCTRAPIYMVGYSTQMVTLNAWQVPAMTPSSASNVAREGNRTHAGVPITVIAMNDRK